MYSLKLNSRFRKSVKKLKSNKSFKKNIFDAVVLTLRKGEKLDEKYKDHQLKGELENYRECHITPDILLIYEIVESELILHLIDIGSHSKLF